jgi:hypothetical protein
MKCVAIFLVIVFVSCNEQRKIQKAKEVLNDHLPEAAAYCAEKFPVKDTTIVKDSVRLDTLYIPGEPITETIIRNDTVYKTITIPGTTYFVTKTVKKDSIIIRRDIAKETALQKQKDNLIIVNKDLVADRDKWKSKYKSNGTQKWVTWILLSIVFAAGIYFKKFTGSASSLFKFIKK